MKEAHQRPFRPRPTAACDERILGAAFKAFTEDGYAAASTLDIATRAKVSKRDLYASFGSKHACLSPALKAAPIECDWLRTCLPHAPGRCFRQRSPPLRRTSCVRLRTRRRRRVPPGDR